MEVLIIAALESGMYDEGKTGGRDSASMEMVSRFGGWVVGTRMEFKVGDGKRT